MPIEYCIFPTFHAARLDVHVLEQYTWENTIATAVLDTREEEAYVNVCSVKLCQFIKELESQYDHLVFFIKAILHSW